MRQINPTTWLTAHDPIRSPRNLGKDFAIDGKVSLPMADSKSTSGKKNALTSRFKSVQEETVTPRELITVVEKHVEAVAEDMFVESRTEETI